MHNLFRIFIKVMLAKWCKYRNKEIYIFINTYRYIICFSMYLNIYSMIALNTDNNAYFTYGWLLIYLNENKLFTGLRKRKLFITPE